MFNNSKSKEWKENEKVKQDYSLILSNNFKILLLLSNNK